MHSLRQVVTSKQTIDFQEAKQVESFQALSHSCSIMESVDVGCGHTLGGFETLSSLWFRSPGGVSASNLQPGLQISVLQNLAPSAHGCRRQGDAVCCLDLIISQILILGV